MSFCLFSSTTNTPSYFPGSPHLDFARPYGLSTVWRCPCTPSGMQKTVGQDIGRTKCQAVVIVTTQRRFDGSGPATMLPDRAGRRTCKNHTRHHLRQKAQHHQQTAPAAFVFPSKTDLSYLFGAHREREKRPDRGSLPLQGLSFYQNLTAAINLGLCIFSNCETVRQREFLYSLFLLCIFPSSQAGGRNMLSPRKPGRALTKATFLPQSGHGAKPAVAQTASILQKTAGLFPITNCQGELIKNRATAGIPLLPHPNDRSAPPPRPLLDSKMSRMPDEPGLRRKGHNRGP